MNILVIGEGLNIFVSSALFASVGNQVYLLTQSSIENYQLEPGLLPLYNEQISTERLKLIDEFDNENKKLDLSIDIIIINEINFLEIEKHYSEVLKRIVGDTSTAILLKPSDIGETQYFKEELSKINLNIEVCSVPLLVREGRAISDFSRPNLILLGCDSDKAARKAELLFYPFNRVKNCIKRVSSTEAEFSNFAGHAMLATRLSFMNEMASLAERLNVDIEVVRECIGLDPRIGKDYLYPGCGFGGRTLEANLKKVAKKLKQRGDDLGLLEVVDKINERQKDLLFRKIWQFFNGQLSGKTIAIWGVAFKPETDSINGSPAIILAESLLAYGCKVRIYDPKAMNSFKTIFPKHEQIVYCKSSIECVEETDVLAICTEWKEFWSPDFQALSNKLKAKAIFDGRNIYSKNLTEEYGIKYFGIGH